MLRKIDKENRSFKVPENYFENFNADMMNLLPEKTTTVKKVSMWKKTLPWVAVAAVACGVILNWSKINQSTNPADIAVSVMQSTEGLSGTAIASVTEEDFYMYVEEQVTASTVREMMMNSEY